VNGKFVAGVVAGLAGLIVFKYGVVGLDGWNSIFHPGRVDAPGAFSKPFLMGLRTCGR
jgi:hypothetical protein